MSANAELVTTERRKDQFPTSSAHLVVPMPYSYPGIGRGAFLMGNFSNVFQSTADVLAMYVTGDATGHILQADELPLLNRHLYLRLYSQDINKAQINQYDTRGMGGSRKDDFRLLDLSLARERIADLNLTFYERRLTFNLQYTDSQFTVDAIRDHAGTLIARLANPYHRKDSRTRLGAALDLTDDYLDPHTGMRIGMNYQNHPAKQSVDPDYYVLTYSGSLYLPLFRTDTLVFNYYQSSAHVARSGAVDPTAIRQELGLNCAATNTACLASEQSIVDALINQRTNGTAASLGGKDRLRSYPQGRFQGGHSAFLGVEYRLNFKDEVKPFNYLFWKDVRTGLQVAFFAETGSVSETASQLWRETRHSYGMGLRLVAASGAVYRADFARGKEGNEFTAFFSYPW